MISRFIELLRSPPSRYESSGDVSRSSMNSLGAPTWGTNGGLDALVRALTWGGDILGIGQQQQGTSGSGGAGRGRLMATKGGSARGFEGEIVCGGAGAGDPDDEYPRYERQERHVSVRLANRVCEMWHGSLSLAVCPLGTLRPASLRPSSY